MFADGCVFAAPRIKPPAFAGGQSEWRKPRLQLVTLRGERLRTLSGLPLAARGWKYAG